MKVLYVTDLHGCEWQYERTLKAAQDIGVNAVINGGDMYPKNTALEKQHRFITGFLDNHFAEYDRLEISFLCMPGNDDLVAFDRLFDSTCKTHSHVFNIAQRKVNLGGFEFIGFNWVVDYPFTLKDRCCMDTPQYKFQQQLGQAILSDGSWPDFRGFKTLDDWFSYANTLPTLEDELRHLVCSSNPPKAIYVIHVPPSD